jgi:hypothetical protein
MPSPQSGAIMPAASPIMHTPPANRDFGISGTWLTALNWSLTRCRPRRRSSSTGFRRRESSSIAPGVPPASVSASVWPIQQTLMRSSSTGERPQ